MHGSRFKLLLYLICGLTDFAGFVVIFAVSRGMAERQFEPWFLGVMGGGLSFCAGLGAVAAGWEAHRRQSRFAFIAGAILIAVSAVLCWAIDVGNWLILPAYWLLGIGLGAIYPPVVGWLNQGVDAHENRSGVSRTLILYCIAWNLGMMCGQVTAGALFDRGRNAIYGAAVVMASITIVAAFVAVRIAARLPASATEIPADRHAAVALAGAYKRLGWIANLGGMFGGSMVIHLLPDLAVAIGVPPENHGFLLASWRGVIIVTYLVMHHAAFWHYRMSTSLASQGLAVVGLAVIASAHSSTTLLAGLALLGQLVGYNYFSGLYYSTAGSKNEGRTLAAGIHEATLAAGMAIGTIAGGVLGSLVNARTPYWLAAAVVVVLMATQAIAWRSWVRPLRERQDAAAIDDAAADLPDTIPGPL